MNCSHFNVHRLSLFNNLNVILNAHNHVAITDNKTRVSVLTKGSSKLPAILNVQILKLTSDYITGTNRFG